MPNSGLSAQHISANLESLAMYEAARSGFFTLIVEDSINNILSAAYTGDPSNAGERDTIGAKAQETLKLNVVNAPVPHFNIKVEQYRRGNEVVRFAGTPDFPESGEITVDDVVGLDTKSILMAWQGLAYNVHTRKGGRMKDYKKNATLIEYTQDFKQIRQWKLFGCWISNITEDNFNKEQDGKRQIRATIVYDRAVMDLSESEEYANS